MKRMLLTQVEIHPAGVPKTIINYNHSHQSWIMLINEWSTIHSFIHIYHIRYIIFMLLGTVLYIMN
jgi:hypothetical protein